MTPLRIASLAFWIAACLMFAPASWRTVRRRPCFLDPLWFATELLALNRVAFISESLLHTGWLQAWCYLMSIACGALFLHTAYGYMRHERC